VSELPLSGGNFYCKIQLKGSTADTLDKSQHQRLPVEGAA